MTKAQVDDYVRIVDYFRNENITSEDEGRRAAVVEDDLNAASSHKLKTLAEKDVLNRWRPGDTAFPVDMSNYERIDGEEAQRRIEERVEMLLELLNNHQQLELKAGEEIREHLKELQTTGLSQKMQALNAAIEEADNAGVDVGKHDIYRVEFRNPAYRYYLKEEFQ